METYLATYKFEKSASGFIATLTNGNPVAEYDMNGRLLNIFDAFCLPVQELVPRMIEGCLNE